MKNTLFWVIFFAAVGVVEILMGVRYFSEDEAAAGITFTVLGIAALVISGVVGVVG